MNQHYADPDSNRASTEIPKTVGGRPDELKLGTPVAAAPHERGIGSAEGPVQHGGNAAAI